MTKRPQRKSRDFNTLAKAITETATGDVEPEPQKHPAKSEGGKRGGLKGGPARAAILTAEQRTEIAKKAAQARWSHKTS